MFERIVASVCLAALGWLDKRITQSKVAVDADADRDRLRLAGNRIREWVQQQQNSVHSRGQSNKDGTVNKG